MLFWNHGGWGVGDWLMMSLSMVAFWAVVIAAVVWVVRASGNDRVSASSGRSVVVSADDVLAERFARGEIDEDEFTRRRGLLHTTAGSSHSTGGA